MCVWDKGKRTGRKWDSRQIREVSWNMDTIEMKSVIYESKLTEFGENCLTGNDFKNFLNF